MINNFDTTIGTTMKLPNEIEIQEHRLRMYKLINSTITLIAICIMGFMATSVMSWIYNLFM